eukprot:137024-Pyramimonas_sp.AAC.1
MRSRNILLKRRLIGGCTLAKNCGFGNTSLGGMADTDRTGPEERGGFHRNPEVFHDPKWQQVEECVFFVSDVVW